MSTLRANFQQTNILQISVALNAVMAELDTVEISLEEAKSDSAKIALMARKKQLQVLLADLQARQEQGKTIVRKNENANILAAAALVYIYLARQAAEQSRLARKSQANGKKAQAFAPKLVA